jgi:hypothetical protein
MRVLLLFLCISSSCYAWQTTHCSGTREERIALLEEFGKAAQKYLRENGSIPNLCNQSIPELEKEIPEGLENYLVCGSSEYDEVHYSCWLEYTDEKQVDEKCKFSLSSEKISCGGITATYDK